MFAVEIQQDVCPLSRRRTLTHMLCGPKNVESRGSLKRFFWHTLRMSNVLEQDIEMQPRFSLPRCAAHRNSLRAKFEGSSSEMSASVCSR